MDERSLPVDWVDGRAAQVTARLVFTPLGSQLTYLQTDRSDLADALYRSGFSQVPGKSSLFSSRDTQAVQKLLLRVSGLQRVPFDADRHLVEISGPPTTKEETAPQSDRDATVAPEVTQPAPAQQSGTEPELKTSESVDARPTAGSEQPPLDDEVPTETKRSGADVTTDLAMNEGAGDLRTYSKSDMARLTTTDLFRVVGGMDSAQHKEIIQRDTLWPAMTVDAHRKAGRTPLAACLYESVRRSFKVDPSISGRRNYRYKYSPIRFTGYALAVNWARQEFDQAVSDEDALSALVRFQYAMVKPRVSAPQKRLRYSENLGGFWERLRTIARDDATIANIDSFLQMAENKSKPDGVDLLQKEQLGRRTKKLEVIDDPGQLKRLETAAVLPSAALAWRNIQYEDPFARVGRLLEASPNASELRQALADLDDDSRDGSAKADMAALEASALSAVLHLDPKGVDDHAPGMLATPICEAETRLRSLKGCQWGDTSVKAPGQKTSAANARTQKPRSSKAERNFQSLPHLQSTRLEAPTTAQSNTRTPEVGYSKSITAADLMREFGFRGVEIGDGMSARDRQEHLNALHAGLIDLSNVLGVPKDALSLGGSLGVSVGRGKARAGGKGLVEYDSANRTLHLCRASGVGMLAHEWAHAFDHYLSERGAVPAARKYAPDFATMATLNAGELLDPPPALRDPEAYLHTHSEQDHERPQTTPTLSRSLQQYVYAAQAFNWAYATPEAVAAHRMTAVLDAALFPAAECNKLTRALDDLGDLEGLPKKRPQVEHEAVAHANHAIQGATDIACALSDDVSKRLRQGTSELRDALYAQMEWPKETHAFDDFHHADGRVNQPALIADRQMPYSLEQYAQLNHHLDLVESFLKKANVSLQQVADDKSCHSRVEDHLHRVQVLGTSALDRFRKAANDPNSEAGIKRRIASHLAEQTLEETRSTLIAAQSAWLDQKPAERVLAPLLGETEEQVRDNLTWNPAGNWRPWVVKLITGQGPVDLSQGANAFCNSAVVLDQRSPKKTAYWRQPEELFARGLESYVARRLWEQGIINAYLSSATPEPRVYSAEQNQALLSAARRIGGRDTSQEDDFIDQLAPFPDEATAELLDKSMARVLANISTTLIHRADSTGSKSPKTVLFSHGKDFATASALDLPDDIRAAEADEVIRRTVGPDVPRYYDAENKMSAGAFRKGHTLRDSLIVISLASRRQMRDTAHHEALHAAMAHLLSDREKSLLNAAFRPGSSLNAKVAKAAEERYAPGPDRDRVQYAIASDPEEATAYGFQFWASGELSLSTHEDSHGVIGNAFRYLKDIFQRTRYALHGYGFSTPEDVFRGLNQGRYALPPNTTERNKAAPIAAVNDVPDSMTLGG